MPNQKFSLVLDSSQINTYMECPEMWRDQYFKRLVPQGVPLESSAMNSGTYGHKLMDIYYRMRRRGLSLNDAVQTAFDYDPDNDTCECGCLKEHHKEITSLKVTECQRCHRCIYPGVFKAKQFQLAQEDRFAVRSRFRDYVLYYQNNDFTAVSEDYVEVGFSENIFEDDENLFVLEGRIDMIATIQGLTCVVDHKFQGRKHDLYKKAIQFKNYAMVSRVSTLFINYVRLMQKVNGDTLVREPVSFTTPELNSWKQKLIRIYFDIKQAIQTDTFRQNWSACPGRFNYECRYTTLCEENDKQMKQVKEKQLYQINANPWRPW